MVDLESVRYLVMLPSSFKMKLPRAVEGRNRFVQWIGCDMHRRELLVAAQLGAHFAGVLRTFPFEGRDCVKAQSCQWTCGIASTASRPGAGDRDDAMGILSHEEVEVLPGGDDVLFLPGLEATRERIGIDIMSSLRDAILHRTSEDADIMSADHVAQTALRRWNAGAMIYIFMYGISLQKYDNAYQAWDRSI